MIFVTVGTHEQQFNRLVRAVDDFVADGTLDDSIFIQTGDSLRVVQIPSGDRNGILDERG